MDTDWIRFKMLTRWLTFMAFLAGSANSRSADSDWRAVTVVSICRVKGQPEVELILNCGDGKHEGWVQFWHTPFGDLQPSSGHTSSVFVHHNGSLVIPRPGRLHSGMYYCVLQHSERSTLWPYELHVGYIDQNTDDKNEQDNSCAAHRTKTSVRNEGVKDGVSDGMFVGAVVASVLVTFVVGFSAGALTRSYVLRCWHAVIMRLRSPKQRRRQADMPDHSSQVIITLPPMHESHTFETETTCDESSICGNVGSRVSVTTPSPPAKPKRSFRNREEKMRDAAYLEGCDYTEERMEEAGGSVGAIKEGSDEEETPQSFFCLEDEELQSETDEDKIIDERKEKEETGGGMGACKWSDEEETTQRFFYLDDEELQSETDEDKITDGEKEAATDEQEKRSEEEVGGEKEEEKTEEVKETERCEELDQSSAGAERGGENKETTMEDEAATSSSAPRRRVIRVYQYDEEGQKYCHLPDPGPEGPEPVPKLRQRSLSLTRLNAIMAAAAAGPMEARESEEAPHFHMEI
ncbi:uncharacterized protein LOC106535731 [Austrofundulus limnaeus]|uniref:Uncharacterized protein LOC106535731 n=1 Tax=Austrofundulus limnaeus TaxID=52670 RepID=A0A2I4D7P6_AUSLI|nr:PREDICTED: uncharacterized protein LOC106535731 [Austrofundulus limnaeus]